MTLCPCCGSPSTASRRQLFYGLMDDTPLTGSFSWYSAGVPHACPPKSLFVMLLLLMLGMVLPAVGLWLLEHYQALQWLSVLSIVLLAALLVDVLRTYRHYKKWGGEWLCGECRSVFSLSLPGTT
jgi:hypothetical protein